MTSTVQIAPATERPATSGTLETAGARAITSSSALFTFYDIESTTNVFTLSAYTPYAAGRRAERADLLEVFYLIDDDDLHREVDARSFAEGGQMAELIFKRNPALPAIPTTRWVAFHDLRTDRANQRLARIMGLSDAIQVNDPNCESSHPVEFRPVCDTDDHYDPLTAHPFLAGYNSFAYDTTMLALYLSEAFPRERRGSRAEPPTARLMREYNSELFSDRFREYMPNFLSQGTVAGELGWNAPVNRIRQAMLHSGRHLDVARLNELQRRVSLKRLLSTLGHQILESTKLGHDSVITSVEEFYELVAYNVSDCVGLSMLFAHPTYSTAFDLKRSLLETYEETIYQSRRRASDNVRRDRLYPDSTSAKFVARILAPYGRLDDIEAVSFDYPATEIIAELNAQRLPGEPEIEQRNVLTDCKSFFESEVAAPHTEAWNQFMLVYDYYRSIEGRNFNHSEDYSKAHPRGPVAQHVSEVAKTPNNLPYLDAQGQPTSCFATFSIGGIHGAEADLTTFEHDCALYRAQEQALTRAVAEFPDACDFVARAKDQHNQLHLPDGTVVDKRLVLIGSDPERVRYRKPKREDPTQVMQLARAQSQVPDPADLLATMRPEASKLDVVLDDGFVIPGKWVLSNTTMTKAAYHDKPAKQRPGLFVDKQDGSTKLHPRYTWTSADHVIHEDFTSYYPNLLRNMRAFYNPQLGEDRYATIFFDKERLGREMKDPALTKEAKHRLATMRNGTKLILNAASGAGDSTMDSPVRMNNRIISMRIIGQLFSWRIGQAQTLAGARITSTNTDGLYAALSESYDESVNNQVLAEQSARINIEIEPEPLYLISKDSNNRLELTLPERFAEDRTTIATAEIYAASGGTLACYDGPLPIKALAHPAVIDRTLAQYLQALAVRGQDAFAEPFDYDLGRQLIGIAMSLKNPVRTALLFQRTIAASVGSITYPFACKLPGPDENDHVVDPVSLPHVNRVFIVRQGTPEAVSLNNVGAWKVAPTTQNKRQRDQQQQLVAGGTPQETSVVTNPQAVTLLREQGWCRDRNSAQSGNLWLLPPDQDVTIRRINAIDPAWPMSICNDDLHHISKQRLWALLDALDLDTYTQLLAETYENNWRNTPPRWDSQLASESTTHAEKEIQHVAPRSHR